MKMTGLTGTNLTLVTTGVAMSAKGSIAIDGISLTVANVSNDKFSIAIIPHTWSETNLNQKSVGDIVNIEVDILAKYIERQLNYNEKETTINV